MALTAGRRLGPYKIAAHIGKGGMGEVYRATDTNLGRTVAIKVLPDAFAADAERLGRFEREARTLAALNHPNIAQIYGLEKAGGIRALIMEFVDGPTLADRIARGPIPIDEALPIARQIAEALAAAHEHSIIHRDLKPANIKVREDGTVKVLDFGLAKMLDAGIASTSVDATDLPTLSLAATQTGVILGTAAYMAPEQAQGKSVDKRADMWAFGCVLYEMLTGRRAFNGSSPTEAIAQTIAGTPDWTALPAGLPDGTARVIRRCLEKSVQRRLRDAGDARLDLEDPAAGNERISRGSRRPLWMAPTAWMVAAASALAVGVALGRRGGETTEAPVVRATIVLPPNQRFQSARRALAISPDGQQIVYSTQEGLYIRRLDAFESRLIPGTADAINPAFSPDGRRLAVWALQGVRSIDPLTGNAIALRSPIADSGGVLGSLSWDEHGLMLTHGSSGVFLFPPDSTDARRIVELAPGEAVTAAQMLPGGRHVLMTVLTQTPLRAGGASGQIVVQSLESASRVPVIDSGSDARYVRSGHIVYAASGALYAMEFDVGTLQARGEPTAVVDGIRATNIINATTHYAVSDTGVLGYVPGQPMPPALALDLVQTDRKGGVKHLHLPSAPYESPRVSPNGQQVALSTDDGTEASIWIHDLAEPSSVRKLTVEGRNRFPVWSPDGRRIAFQSNRDGDVAIFAQAADGSDAALRLTRADAGTTHTPESWSPSGDDLLFGVTKGETNSLWRLSLSDRRVEPFAGVASTSPISAAFSPNGKWVAYNTRVAGAIFGAGHAVFVQPFPATGAIYQVSSNDDGHHPAWSRDGRELFYIPAPGRLAVVNVSGESSFAFSTPTSLPPAGLMGPGTFNRHYDPLGDGSGFIGRQVAEDEDSRLGAPPRIQIVSNWLEDLNQRRQRR